MNVTINGEKELLTDQISVSTLLKEKDVERPEMVSVQLNGEFVEREQFDSVVVKENDEVDFLYFMGGGSE